MSQTEQMHAVIEAARRCEQYAALLDAASKETQDPDVRAVRRYQTLLNEARKAHSLALAALVDPRPHWFAVIAAQSGRVAQMHALGQHGNESEAIQAAGEIAQQMGAGASVVLLADETDARQWASIIAATL